jgi:hypothetical protein
LIGSRSLRDSAAEPVRSPGQDGPLLTRRGASALNHELNDYVPVTCECGVTLSVPDVYKGQSVDCIHCGKILSVPA